MRLVDLNVFAEKSAREFAAGRAAPGIADAWALRAFTALYQAGGRPQYRETVLSWLEKRVSREGAIDLPAGGSGYKKEILGAALLFADRETQDGRYRLAAEKLMETAGSIPGGMPDESAALSAMEDTFLLMPFRAEYDARLGTKQLARFIAARFQTLRKALPLEALPPHVFGMYMAALADTLEKMEIQLYEHYRALEDLLVEAARASLSRLNGPVDKTPQMGGGGMLTVYALLKGARMGWLDEEKYLRPAKKAYESLLDALPEASDEPPAKKARCACLMAFSEEGRLRKE